jgi:hypothetical protein
MGPVLLAGIAAGLWIGVLDKVVRVWRAPEDLPLRALAACVVVRLQAPRSPPAS